MLSRRAFLAGLAACTAAPALAVMTTATPRALLASSFRLTDLPNLKLLCQPNRGQAAGQWDDISGNANHLTVSGATLNADGSYTFDGVNDKMVTPSMTLAPPFMAYVVAKQRSWTDNEVIMDGLGANLSALIQQAGATPALRVYAGTNVRPCNTNLALNTWGVITAGFGTGADSFLRINEKAPFTINAGTGNPAGLTFGSSQAGAFFGNFDMMAVAVYSGALHTAAQQNRVIRALGRLAGIATAATAPQIVCDGNSLTAGTGALAGQEYPEQLRALLPTYDMLNFGVSGQTTAQMTADAATQIDVCYDARRPKNILLAWEVTNSLFFGATATAAYNDYVAYCSARRAIGPKVVAFTVLPRSDAGVPAGFETSRGTVNTNIRANWATFADALCDVAGDSRIGDAGDELDTTYYAADKVHMIQAGYAIIAGLAQTAVNSL